MYANVPAPLPDECLRGYGFRVNASNAKNLLTTHQLLPDLSEASGLSIPYLVTNHSHLAYTRFAHSTYGYLDTQTHQDLISNIQISSGKTPIHAARYCPLCTKEDIDSYGISYWHRLHHLPGVDHCIKHNVSLIYADSMDGYSCEPLFSSKFTPAIPNNKIESYFKSDHIQKFSYLSSATLEIGLSFEHNIIRDALINRHKRLKQGPYIDFLKLAYKKFPSFWLNMLFFGIESSKRPVKSEKLLYALKNDSNTKPIKAYLILMALFWNDPNEALRECLSAYYSRPLEDGRIYFMKNKYRSSAAFFTPK